MANVYAFKDFEGSSHRILIDLIERYARKGNIVSTQRAQARLAELDADGSLQ